MQILLLSLTLAAPVEPPTFVVVSPAAERPTGPLLRLSSDFTATLKSAEGQKTVPHVISLRRASLALPPFPTAPHLITTVGDRIAGTLVGGDSRSLRFAPSFLGPGSEEAWKVPLSSAVLLWITDTPAETPLDVSRYNWLDGIKNRDVLRFRNGDLARGTIDGLDPDAEPPTFPFQPDQGPQRSVAARQLAAVAFNPALVRTRKPKGAFARVVLLDGSRISLANTSVAEGILTGMTLFGEKARLPLSAVVGIDVIGGKAVALGELKPKKVEQTGFLGSGWHWAADRSVLGGGLRIKTAQGETFADKGIGTHPRTVLTYELGASYQSFEALVGIDPHSAIQSTVIVRVLVDGKEQVISGLPSLAAGNAVPIRVVLSGAKELTLVTDFAPKSGVGADVNWVDARLVK